MKAPKLLGPIAVALTLCLLLLAACGDDEVTTTPAAPTSATGATGVEGFTGSEYDAFVSDCSSAATATGAPADDAEEVCGCVAQQFQAQGLTVQEANDLVAGGGAPRQFTEALEKCLGNLPSG